MKKIAFLLALVMLAAVFSSCGLLLEEPSEYTDITQFELPAGSTPTPANIPVAEETDGEEALPAPSVAPVNTDLVNRSRTQQYGYTESVIRYGDNFNGVIYYPASDMAAADTAIRNWAEYYMDSMEDVVGIFDDSVEGMSADIYVHYDSYLCGDRYVGIQEDGYYNSTIMIHPLELLYTVNLDLETGELLAPSDILTKEGIDYVLSTAKNTLMAQGIGEKEFSHMDDSWMEFSVLTNEGLRMTIFRGLHISDRFGSHTFTFPYEEIADYLKIDIFGEEVSEAPDDFLEAFSEAPLPTIIGECTCDGVRICANATTSSHILGEFRNGDRFDIIEHSVVDGWDCIMYNDQIAFVPSRYVAIVSDDGKLLKVGEVGSCTGEGVNIRTEPSIHSEILSKATFGQTIEVIRKDIPSGWHEILYLGDRAYITSEYVKFPSDSSAKPSSHSSQSSSSGSSGAATVPVTPIAVPASSLIDPSKPMIALTFDDGPSKTTGHILDLLEIYGARATFCVVGNRVENNVKTISRAIRGGNEIACHTWDHENLKKISETKISSEISDTVNIIKSLTGYNVRILRPPYGSTNDVVSNVCKEQGLVIANWSIDTLDWKTRDPDATYKAIMKDVKDGAIILCHDTYGATGEAMERVIPELIRQGYQFVTVSELLQYKIGNPTPGKLYRHG